MKNGPSAFTTKWHLRRDAEKIDTDDGGQAQRKATVACTNHRKN